MKKYINSLRDNEDGTCNCKPMGGGCFFTDIFGNHCDCKCHVKNNQYHNGLELLVGEAKNMGYGIIKIANTPPPHMTPTKEENFEVELADKDTALGKFQTERTKALSEMFENEYSNGIFPTSKLFYRLDKSFKELLSSSLETARKEWVEETRAEIENIRTIGKEYGEEGYSTSDNCLKKEVLSLPSLTITTKK